MNITIGNDIEKNQLRMLVLILFVTTTMFALILFFSIAKYDIIIQYLQTQCTITPTTELMYNQTINWV